MKKSILMLIAVMLLSLSFAKAQLVTMYDLVLQTRSAGGNTYVVPNKNISFYDNFKGAKTLAIDNQNIELVLTTSNGANTIPSRDGRSWNGISEYKGMSTSLQRTYFVWVSGNKTVVGFYDDPDPVNEYINKLIEKGF